MSEVRRQAALLQRPNWGWQDEAACRGKEVVLFFGPDGERQPEGAGAPSARPHAEDRYPSVGVPAQPHTPGIAPDVEEDLTEARQRRCVGRGHDAYGGPNYEICPVNDH